MIKVRGSDPIYAWNGEHHVYIRKEDWIRASPAIRTIEACVLLRMTPQWFRVCRELMGVVPKRTNHHKLPDVPKQGPQTYYTINDLVQVSRCTKDNPRGTGDFASEHEIRNLFSEGYVAYKRTKAGDFIPVWSETIY